MSENRPLIIAEAATNHGGDLSLAKEMVHAAKDAGADMIKFQSWRIATMSPDHPAYAAMKPKELSDDAHRELMDLCQKTGIGFLTTCFDTGRVDFLASLGLGMIKAASTDVTSIRLLKMLREKFSYVILSTGMSDQSEVARAAKILSAGSFCLMHCVSLYPTPAEKANLARMNWLRQFGGDVGYSDHTLGTAACKSAIAMGARYIEKHFTLKKDMANVFSALSAVPDELREIAAFRDEFTVLRGEGNTALTPEELESRGKFVGRWGDNR